MKIAGRENPNRWTKASSNRTPGAAVQEQILLHQTGCESRKSPAGAGVFFLDSPFYRTYKTAGTAKLRGSHIRQHILTVSLWVGKLHDLRNSLHIHFPEPHF